jgi:hypothetical protein
MVMGIGKAKTVNMLKRIVRAHRGHAGKRVERVDIGSKSIAQRCGPCVYEAKGGRSSRRAERHDSGASTSASELFGGSEMKGKKTDIR